MVSERFAANCMVFKRFTPKKRLERDLCDEARIDRHHQPTIESPVSHKQSAACFMLC